MGIVDADDRLVEVLMRRIYRYLQIACIFVHKPKVSYNNNLWSSHAAFFWAASLQDISSNTDCDFATLSHLSHSGSIV